MEKNSTRLPIPTRDGSVLRAHKAEYVYKLRGLTSMDVLIQDYKEIYSGDRTVCSGNKFE